MVETNPALGRSLGRDHHPQAFTMWMAGGGIKPGITYGATDDLGFHVVENPVHVHDLQATILHLLGLDHEQLTYRYAGRDFRLTDVFGKVDRTESLPDDRRLGLRLTVISDEIRLPVVFMDGRGERPLAPRRIAP